MRRIGKILANIILDFALAAALVLGNYVYNYKIPRQLPSLNETVSQESTASGEDSENSVTGEKDNSQTTGDDSEVQDTTESDTESDSDTTEQTSSEEWSSKFSEYFSDQVVSTDMSYSSSDISVTITKESYGSGADTVTYFVADIYISSIDCFKTKFADDTYGVGYKDNLTNMSESVSAILAINGDSYSSDLQKRNGPVIRNGTVYRKDESDDDVCVLYYDGTMQTYSPEDFDVEQVISDGAYQTWAFGPALLNSDGSAKTSFNTGKYLSKTHPRTAIGYYEPGHYAMVVVDGRQTDTNYSKGMDLEELAQVFENLGCSAAYNLDGGHNSLMTLSSSVVNQPYKNTSDLSDCIYIAEP